MFKTQRTTNALTRDQLDQSREDARWLALYSCFLYADQIRLLLQLEGVERAETWARDFLREVVESVERLGATLRAGAGDAFTLARAGEPSITISPEIKATSYHEAAYRWAARFLDRVAFGPLNSGVPACIAEIELPAWLDRRCIIPAGSPDEPGYYQAVQDRWSEFPAIDRETLRTELDREWAIAAGLAAAESGSVAANDEIPEARDDGQGTAYLVGVVADDCGCDVETCRKYIRAAGLALPGRGKRNHTYTGSERLRILHYVARMGGTRKVRSAAARALEEAKNKK